MGRTGMLYGAAAIAGHLGITRRQVFHMVERGRLPVFREGRVICATPSALATWLAQREAASRPPSALVPVEISASA